MPKFCPNCGSPCDGAKFCPECGKNLQNSLDNAAPIPDLTLDLISEAPIDAPLFDFEKLAAEASKTAVAIKLEAFRVEQHTNGKYEIVGLKNRRDLEISVPDCVEAIADNAFEGCAAFEIHLPEGLIKIGKRAFANAKDLEKINIPSTVKVIDDEAFDGCENLEIQIPKSVRRGRDVLKNTVNGKREERAKQAEGDRQAFSLEHTVEYDVLKKYNDKVEHVTIPEGIVGIGVRAFEYCPNFKSIVIPSSMNHIETGAFVSCTGLTSITVSEDNGKYHSKGNCIIETATKKLIVGCSQSIIPNDGSVTCIGGWAFFGCHTLSGITIPDSVTSIEHDAFYNCVGLESITLPNQLAEIGDCAFHNCDGLMGMIIPDSVEHIGKDVFGCRGNASVLKAIKLPRRFASQLGYIGIDPTRTHVTYT